MRAAVAARRGPPGRPGARADAGLPARGRRPGTTLAAHLLGFVNRDGAGQYGVEAFWQELLAGRPRVLLAERDAAGQPSLDERRGPRARAAPGADLTLTIDASLQLALEREVYAAWVADRAKSVSAVVMDPTTGEILAQATYPSYDANGYQAVADEDPGRFVDPVVSAVYEPGSVFKMLTAAAALEAGVVKRTTQGPRPGEVLAPRRRSGVRHERRQGVEGRMTFQDAVAWSRNVVMCKVALELGSTTRAAARRPPRGRGRTSASGRRPASTWPARCAGLVRTRRRRRGGRSTSPTARSARASRSRSSSWRRPTARWSTAGTLPSPHVVQGRGAGATRPRRPGSRADPGPLGRARQGHAPGRRPPSRSTATGR